MYMYVRVYILVYIYTHEKEISNILELWIDEYLHICVYMYTHMYVLTYIYL